MNKLHSSSCVLAHSEQTEVKAILLKLMLQPVFTEFKQQRSKT
jgi:hypothetical protein